MTNKGCTKFRGKHIFIVRLSCRRQGGMKALAPINEVSIDEKYDSFHLEQPKN